MIRCRAWLARPPTRVGWVVALSVWILVAAYGDRAHSDERPSLIPELPRVAAEGVPGALVICGGGELPEEIRARFVAFLGGKSGRLVVVPTAADDESAERESEAREPWLRYELASLVVRHTRSREVADSAAFVEPLRDATGVWFGGGQQSRLADAYVGTAFERELMALLRRGGVVGGTSAGAAIQSRRLITGGNPTATTGVGFDLLPGAVIDQHFSQRNRQPRLSRVLADQPGFVGYGVDEATALIVHGRRGEVLGRNQVVVCFAEGAGRDAECKGLPAGSVFDVVAFHRAAIERAGTPFPLPEPAAPRVPSGALVIGGGGRLPPVVLDRFLALAGGPDAKIVVIPTASDAKNPDGAAERRLLERAGAKNVAVLLGRGSDVVESAESLALLDSAQGVWFGGGRQWRFIDAYAGTQVVAKFHGVLRRGGVLGGSSAGASIQAEYLVRGSPLGNREMSAEGYERGFAFLPGTAIDQHFSQRKRQPDLQRLVTRYPQLLGIGIDEGTALVVRGEQAEVLGDHQVTFYHRQTDPTADRIPEGIQVQAGAVFNLRTKQVEPRGESSVSPVPVSPVSVPACRSKSATTLRRRDSEVSESDTTAERRATIESRNRQIQTANNTSTYCPDLARADRLRLRDAEVPTNLASQKLVDFSVSWNGRRLVVVGIEVHAVLTTFAQ